MMKLFLVVSCIVFVDAEVTDTEKEKADVVVVKQPTYLPRLGVPKGTAGSSVILSGGNNVLMTAGKPDGTHVNRNIADFSVIAGGNSNFVSGSFATVLGGASNRVLSNFASVVGGFSNAVSGRFSSVLGGSKNTVSGRWGLAGGLNAQVKHDMSAAFAFRGDDKCVVGGENEIRMCAKKIVLDADAIVTTVDGKEVALGSGSAGTDTDITELRENYILLKGLYDEMKLELESYKDATNKKFQSLDGGPDDFVYDGPTLKAVIEAQFGADSKTRSNIVCKEHWEGVLCHQDIKDCAEGCSGHGTCTEGEAGTGAFTCKCDGGFTGKRCQDKCSDPPIGKYFSGFGCDQSECKNELQDGYLYSSFGDASGKCPTKPGNCPSITKGPGQADIIFSDSARAHGSTAKFQCDERHEPKDLFKKLGDGDCRGVKSATAVLKRFYKAGLTQAQCEDACQTHSWCQGYASGTNCHLYPYPDKVPHPTNDDQMKSWTPQVDNSFALDTITRIQAMGGHHCYVKKHYIKTCNAGTWEGDSIDCNKCHNDYAGSSCDTRLSVRNGDFVWMKWKHANWFYCTDGNLCKASQTCPNSKSQRTVSSNTGCTGERFQIFSNWDKRNGDIMSGDTVWLKYTYTGNWVYGTPEPTRATQTCPNTGTNRNDGSCSGERFVIANQRNVGKIRHGDTVYLLHPSTSDKSWLYCNTETCRARASCPGTAIISGNSVKLKPDWNPSSGCTGEIIQFYTVEGSKGSGGT